MTRVPQRGHDEHSVQNESEENADLKRKHTVPEVGDEANRNVEDTASS